MRVILSAGQLSDIDYAAQLIEHLPTQTVIADKGYDANHFVAKIEVFAAAKVFADADASAVARNLVLLLVAWSVLSTVIASRWKGAVEEDERDRDIAARAAAWGRGALVLAVIMLAVALGLSPASRLQWASHFLVANLLVLAVMWGCLFEYAAGAVLHWRARR